VKEARNPTSRQPERLVGDVVFRTRPRGRQLVRLAPPSALAATSVGKSATPAATTPSQSAVYTDPGLHAEGFVYLQGEWTADEENVMKPWGSGGESAVTIKYTAKEANLVMTPLLGKDCRAYLTQDGAPLAKEDAGMMCASRATATSTWT
jgi:hypothetical protein